jgi:prepilin-type N-terminal cleavage/methylation domain-containing protein
MTTEKFPTQARLGQRKKGFTLTEIAIVLGIMGLVLGAIWVAAAAVYNNQRVNQGNTAVMQVLQAVRTLYAQRATITTGDRTAELVAAGVIPTNLVNGTGMAAPWGGTMFVSGTADGLGVAIVMNGMTPTLCVGLVAQIAGASHDRTFSGNSMVGSGPITAAGGAALNTGNIITGSPAPTPRATAAAASALGAAPANTNCSPGVNTNSAAFVFGLQG